MTETRSLQRILIFDDDSDFRKLLLVRLGKMFPEVELEEYDPIARGVPELDFDWSRYDVLLLDYFLCIHGVTGLDILRKNRKNPLFPTTIMLTGAGNEEIAVRALKSGVSDYIRKETLNKEELRKSILNAYEENKLERQRTNDATLHSHAFNKGLFYQQLEKPEPDAPDRILLLIQLDNHEKIARVAGVILRDNMVRHIAKQAFEVFQIGGCNPSITRFSEVSIGLLIDDPASAIAMDFNLQGLCNHLNKRPYKFDSKKYRYTVSIGVVSTAISANSAEAIIKMANATVISASNKQGENSYEICNEAHTVAAPPTKRPTTEIPATTTTKVDEELSITIEESKDNKPAAEVTPTAERSATLTVDVEKSDNIVEQSGQGEEHAADKPAPIPAPKPAPTTEAKAVPKPVPKPAPTPAPQGPAVKASPPAAEKPSKPHESDDAVLDDATLNIAALAVKRSFEEKRVVQTFQPVISFLAEEEENESELYATSLQLIDPDGLTVGAEEIMSRVKKVPSFPKYIDRWMLREAIGRAAHSSHDRYVFLMKISDASLADATLFNWLRELLSGLGKSHPGRAVALEISADTFSSRQKQAEALMTFLHKSHGFKFMLAHVKDVESMKTLTKKTNFDFLKVSPALIKQLSEEVSADAEEGGSLLTSLKKRGTAIVVQDVEDATTLTEVISIGADYAIGEFIGEASSQLDDLTNVESFEIS